MTTPQDINIPTFNPSILYFPTQLQAEQLDIYFKEQGKKFISCPLHIKNSSDELIAFKVLRFKNDSRYIARPDIAYVGKGETAIITIQRDVRTLPYDSTSCQVDLKVHIRKVDETLSMGVVEQYWDKATREGMPYKSVDVEAQIVKGSVMPSITPTIEYSSFEKLGKKEDTYAKIVPSTIQFMFPRGRNSAQRKNYIEYCPSSVLNLQNVYHSRISFKVMTANSARYVVRPNDGFIDPGSFQAISIYLFTSTIPRRTESCVDKFIVTVRPTSDADEGYQKVLWFSSQLTASSLNSIGSSGGPSQVEDTPIKIGNDTSSSSVTKVVNSRETMYDANTRKNYINSTVPKTVHVTSVRDTHGPQESSSEQGETPFDILQNLMAERYQETEKLESQRMHF